MLPLISNVLPTALTSQPTTVAAAQSAFQAAQSAAGIQPLTPVAVSAAGAATGFSAQLPTPPRRDSAVRVSVAQAQPDRPAILPDPEFWKVPTREAGQQIAPLPSRQQIIESIQQAVQFTAQASVQEEVAVPVKQAPQHQPVTTKRFNALLAKKPDVGNSTGLGAYNIAGQRNMHMSFPPSVNASA